MPDRADETTPDFQAGVAFETIPDGGLLTGHVGDDPVLLTRSGEDVRGFSAKCTHLGAQLGEGLVVDGMVRCPWHHACFDLSNGHAVAAPAFDPLQRWKVDRDGPLVKVSGKAARDTHDVAEARSDTPGIVIVGGGAAGFAAAVALRREGSGGAITMVSDDTRAPYDRTLLTKDYLDGKFGDDRLPIAKTTLDEIGVDLILKARVARIDRTRKAVVLDGGRSVPYAKLLLATGAAPVRLDVPGADLPHVHVLRSADDCRAVLDGLASARHVVVVGSSFIGLEAAASIRSRGVDVTVVTPEEAPMAKKIGPELSAAIVAVHRQKGVHFHLGAKVGRIAPDTLTLVDGTVLPADLVVVGIGVTPRLELATEAGLAIDDGVSVDAHLRTSDPDIYAAGDIARWPDPRCGPIRVEHWVAAGRQGEAAAANMLGHAVRYEGVPFFWSKHFDFSFRYVGHADTWDTIMVEGDIGERKAILHYRKEGRDLAVATVGQDIRALEIERDMERD